jgi:molybdopterin-guanine dinucleotide biosynthesis protein MobB
MSERPPIVCFVGKKKSGKTTVSVAVVAELGRRGHRVMTVKHGHGFDLDRQGTDSWRHRHEGGARRVVMAAPGGFAIVGDWPDGRAMGPAEIAERFLHDADIVVVEGFKSEGLPKIEVYRRSSHPEPVFPLGDPAWSEYLAIATDVDVEDVEAPFPVLDVEDPELAVKLADIVEAEFFG